MNALELLAEQHEEVEDLFEMIEKADGQKKADLFVEIADKLAAHATMEERLFYPAVKARQTEELLVESSEEHLAIKRVLADLLELDPDDEHFDAKLKVMQEEIRHHAREEEEDKLFPLVEKLMDDDELERLGAEMEGLFEQLLSEEPRRNVPEETGEAAPI
jgi:hemerythrin superfamily protein